MGNNATISRHIENNTSSTTSVRTNTSDSAFSEETFSTVSSGKEKHRSIYSLQLNDETKTGDETGNIQTILEPRENFQQSKSLEIIRYVPNDDEKRFIYKSKSMEIIHSFEKSNELCEKYSGHQNSMFELKTPNLEDISKTIREGIRENNTIKIKNALSLVSGEKMRYIYKEFCKKKPEICLASRVIINELKGKILRQIKNKEDVKRMWVGRQDKSIEGIDTFVIVTRSSKFCKLGDQIFGLNLLVRCADTCSDEASNMLIHDTNDSLSSLSVQLSESEINSLFKKHSNITLINTSNVCSVGYKSNAKLERIPSIVIHCHIKGVIPIGEDAFPKKINGHRVDVREAVCNFAVNPSQLSERIVNEDTTRTGTLGGFVTLQNPERQAFVTCAHVVLPFDVLKNGETSECVKRRVINVVDKNGKQFGIVHKAVFKHGQESQVSIDAALVEITDQYRYPCDGNFAPVFTFEQIMETGFSENNMPRFDNGEMEQVSTVNFRNPVLKIGAKSGLTIGSLKIGMSCARIHDYDVQVGNNFSTTLFKQMEVIPQFDLSQPSDSREPFLDYGDSGSFVYFISQQYPVALKCIGLAVAKTSHGTCLMTPIDKVFEALDLPFNCLSKFRNEETKGDAISNISSKLDNILKKMATTDDIRKIEGDISSIKDRLSSTESNVKTLLERNIEETTRL